jgi:uncharacterized protein YkwD
MTTPSDHEAASGMAVEQLRKRIESFLAIPCNSAFVHRSTVRTVHSGALSLLFALILSSSPFGMHNAMGASKLASVRHSEQNRKIATVELVEEKILRFTNEERVKRGLPRLRSSHALTFLAKVHCDNMCRTGRFEHESRKFPKGWRTFGSRLQRAGLGSGAENIGYQSLHGNSNRWARKMVKGWMNSPSHRKNILDRRFRYLGVGIRPCGNKSGFAAQVFSPRSGKVQ